MSGKFLDRYQVRSPGTGAAPDEAGGNETVECNQFGWLRGTRERAVMLVLRSRDGRIAAIPYAGIDRMIFDPSDGITLFAGGGRIRIVGINLNTEVREGVRLFDGLTRHRVTWVRESCAGDSLLGEEHGVSIERIEMSEMT